MGALDALIYGYRIVLTQALELAQRKRLSFGPGFTVTDDEVNEWTRVELVDTTDVPGRVRVALLITAVNYQITIADHVVVASVDGLTITLPASPDDGDEYEVKSATGVSGTIIDGGAETIIGSATYEQSEGENTVLRFAGTQWETF